MNSKYKYLLKNFGILSIASFSSKLISFFLVPFYTSILTTEEYGTYDFLYTTVSLLIPILTINIANAVMRFSLGGKHLKTQVLGIGYFFWGIGVCGIIALILLNNYFGVLVVVKEYAAFFFLMFVTQSMYELLVGYTRGQEQILDLSIASVFYTFSFLLLNIFFLAIMKLRIEGYFWAVIISTTFSTLYLFIKTRAIAIPVVRKNELQAEMIHYSWPLVFNSIAWWINGSLDRYVITWLCGIAANGIYSIAGKIPSILNMIQTVFNQAWTLSAVKEYDKDDHNNYFSNVYNYYNLLLVIASSLIIMFDKVIAKILFAKEFYQGWIYVPYLTIAIVFGALSGQIGGVFSAVKRSNIIAGTTIVGASINLMLNISLVYFIGPIGAAVATMMSYIVVWFIRLIKVKKYISITLDPLRDVIVYVLLIVQGVSNTLIKNNIISICIEIAIFVSILLTYRKNIIEIKNRSLKS